MFLITRLYKRQDTYEQDLKAFKEEYHKHNNDVLVEISKIQINSAVTLEKITSIQTTINKTEAMLVRNDNAINALRAQHLQQTHKDIND